MLRGPLDHFSVAMTGNSGGLMSIFATEFMEAFKAATLYESSDKFLAFQASEVRLGKTKFANPEFRRMALAMERNMRKPAPVAVTVNFLREGETETVIVKGRLERRQMLFRWDYAKDIVDVENAVQQIIAAVATVP